MCIYFIYENFKSLAVQTCILGHVGRCSAPQHFFPMSILKVHAIRYLCKFCHALLLKLPWNNKGLYLVAKPNSQPCPSRKTLVNASYMLARQANRITWEDQKRRRSEENDYVHCYYSIDMKAIWQSTQNHSWLFDDKSIAFSSSLTEVFGNITKE